VTSTRKLWTALIALLVASFGVLLWVGYDISHKDPPVPERVVTESGATVYTRADIQRGRQVWQSMGGMQLGSIWGHGGYVAPDWSADWLHREALALLNSYAEGSYDALGADKQAALQERLRHEMRPRFADVGVLADLLRRTL
jgi:nitric oxide reductase subunit B